MTVEGLATLLSIVVALFAFDLTLLLKVWKVRAADWGNSMVVPDDPRSAVVAKLISVTESDTLRPR